MLASLTDAQCERQTYEMLGYIVEYLLGDKERNIQIRAENGQLKIGVSTVTIVEGKKHRGMYSRTVDPQQAKPHTFTTQLCREMGGAALITICQGIDEAILAVSQYTSS